MTGRRARASGVLGSSVTAFVVGLAGAAKADVSISVDATAPGAPLTPVWAYHGYDEANYTTSREGRALLRSLARVHSAEVRVRTHFLFNTGDGKPALKWGSTNVYTEDRGGNPIYDYRLIDEIMDSMVASGVVPLVELGFMPEALSVQPTPYRNSSPYVLDGGSFHPPDDYEAWGNLVGAWAAHVKERYPETLPEWQWELWNEPDIGYWRGTFEEFTRLYDTTEAALHAVLPDAVLGGPAVARADGEFFAQFLEHCASGTNTLTGETGTRLDFVTFHGKGGVQIVEDHVQLDLGNQLRLHRAGFETVARSAFRDRPIVISEADPDGCAACPVSTAPHFAYRLSPAYGAYVVAMMKHTLGLAEAHSVELAGVLTWAFTFPGSPYFAGYRALATNGIRLPVLNAFELLGNLVGDRVPVESSGAQPLPDILVDGVRGEADIDALAVRDGDRVRILVWHYHDDVVASDPATVTLDVALPMEFADGARVTHTRVDHEHGDAHSAWVALGSPEQPSATERAQLREAMRPVVLESRVATDLVNEHVRVEFELPRFGLSLLLLEPAKPPTAETPVANEPGSSCAAGPTRNARIEALLALMLVAAAFRRR